MPVLVDQPSSGELAEAWRRRREAGLYGADGYSPSAAAAAATTAATAAAAATAVEEAAAAATERGFPAPNVSSERFSSSSRTWSGDAGGALVQHEGGSVIVSPAMAATHARAVQAAGRRGVHRKLV